MISSRLNLPLSVSRATINEGEEVMISLATEKQEKVVTDMAREIGHYGGTAPGPIVVCIGGIHGNEPAGVIALKNVLKRLSETKPQFQGELIGLAGNRRALSRGVRYLDQDLNRMWMPHRVWSLKSEREVSDGTSENLEQRELLAEIEKALGHNPESAIFLDLHTTSADGAPFAIISDTLINRRLALQMNVPIILGLEENLDGTILNYINELGHAAIGFEAGQHDAASSVQNHENAIWITLVGAGCLSPDDAPPVTPLRQQLKAAARGVPGVLEMRYRHGITTSDDFEMNPGYLNFHKATRGQVVARDRRGEIRLPESGFLFMPLYQKQGDDGFFLVREIKPYWLKVSALLRRLHTDRILPLLPGVDPLTEKGQAYLVNTRIARWFVIEIFHLLGFRKHAEVEGKLIVSRRRQSPEE